MADTGLDCALGLPTHPEAAVSDALRMHLSVRRRLDVFCLDGVGQVLSSTELATSPDWLQEHQAWHAGITGVKRSRSLTWTLPFLLIGRENLGSQKFVVLAYFLLLN